MTPPQNLKLIFESTKYQLSVVKHQEHVNGLTVCVLLDSIVGKIVRLESFFSWIEAYKVGKTEVSWHEFGEVGKTDRSWKDIDMIRKNSDSLQDYVP